MLFVVCYHAHSTCYLRASLSIFLLSMLFVLFVSLSKRALLCMALHGNVDTCIEESGCYTVNLPISASIGNECVKGPCQDTIAALWACNVRPSIGTHRTIGALEGESITTMLISGQQRWQIQIQQTKFFHLDICTNHWHCDGVLVSGSTVTVRLSLWNKGRVWGPVNCERFSAAYVGRRVTQWLIKPVDFHLADCSVCRSSWPTLQGTIRPDK